RSPAGGGPDDQGPVPEGVGLGEPPRGPRPARAPRPAGPAGDRGVAASGPVVRTRPLRPAPVVADPGPAPRGGGRRGGRRDRPGRGVRGQARLPRSRGALRLRARVVVAVPPAARTRGPRAGGPRVGRRP